jgi:hypothetical protein
VGVVSALALAAPVAEADAAPQVTRAYAGYIIPRVAFVYGGLALNDVFNGGTTVVVSTGAAFATTAGSP